MRVCVLCGVWGNNSILMQFEASLLQMKIVCKMIWKRMCASTDSHRREEERERRAETRTTGARAPTHAHIRHTSAKNERKTF